MPRRHAAALGAATGTSTPRAWRTIEAFLAEPRARRRRDASRSRGSSISSTASGSAAQRHRPVAGARVAAGPGRARCTGFVATLRRRRRRSRPTGSRWRWVCVAFRNVAGRRSRRMLPASAAGAHLGRGGHRRRRRGNGCLISAAGRARSSGRRCWPRPARARSHVVYRHDTPAFAETDWTWVRPLRRAASAHDPGWYRRHQRGGAGGATTRRLWAEGRLQARALARDGCRRTGAGATADASRLHEASDGRSRSTSTTVRWVDECAGTGYRRSSTTSGCSRAGDLPPPRRRVPGSTTASRPRARAVRTAAATGTSGRSSVHSPPDVAASGGVGGECSGG